MTVLREVTIKFKLQLERIVLQKILIYNVIKTIATFQKMNLQDEEKNDATSLEMTLQNDVKKEEDEEEGIVIWSENLLDLNSKTKVDLKEILYEINDYYKENWWSGSSFKKLKTVLKNKLSILGAAGEFHTMKIIQKVNPIYVDILIRQKKSNRVVCRNFLVEENFI